MTIYTVDDAVINSPEAEGYFQRADRRVAIGFRATLELLGIDVPAYAVRRKPGRTPAGDVMQAYRVDNPAPRSYTQAPRKPNASPAIALPVTSDAGPGLFASTFIVG